MLGTKPSVSTSSTRIRILIWFLLATTHQLSYIKACTNVLITPGATATNETLIAYNADSGNLMGQLYHYPARNATDSAAQTMRKIWNWDTGAYLGTIPESPSTYNVVGNTNEHGLVIAETTFGGISILADPSHQPDAKIDYGSLIYIALQRSRNAREAIRTMANLMDSYGYASEGESFSIADATGEVWIMEVIGRGEGKVGAVWVAVRVPDGMIAAHSNQARITTFPRDDPENCLYAHDVVDLAKEIGVYASSEDDPGDLRFSFSDTYDPLTFMGARASDARTWAIFSLLAQDEHFQSKYQDYALGQNLTNRMPLYIRPKHKLSFHHISTAMSNHYESTPLDSSTDVGAGSNSLPYRPRPLLWSHSGKKYHNERTVATQQTGWNFIAQIRSDLPPPIASVLHFAVDDSSTSPRFPVYGGSTGVSAAYGGKGTQDGVYSPLLEFDFGKAFWVQNMVSNLVYTRWSEAYPIVRERIHMIQERFLEEVHLMDKRLLAMLDGDGEEESMMVRFATEFGVTSGDNLHKEWLAFYGELFARFRDFTTVVEDKTDPICRCTVNEVGLSEDWKTRIVEETGSHYECGDDGSVPDIFVKEEQRLRGSMS